MYNYTPQATHHAKFDFDQTTWVAWANSQFATVLGVFLGLSSLFSSARLQVAPADESSAVHAYKTCFAPNNYTRNRYFQAKMLKHEMHRISENAQPNVVKIYLHVTNTKCNFPMQYDYVITNSRWWTDTNHPISITFCTKMLNSIPKIDIWQTINFLQAEDSVWRHNEFFFLMPTNAKFELQMKNHMQGHWTKRAIFANSTWRTAAIFKIVLCPHTSRKPCEFDRIWHAGANLHSQYGIWQTWKYT